MYLGCDRSEAPVITRIVHFFRSEQGATAVEYAVMLAMIIMIAFASITLFGSRSSSMWSNISSSMPT
jgi:pilus assembly protein Flp/PilA